ncbi:hypothetical protein CTheo_8501 [Ceratobasidium theobromae]|uniref:Uncharacterized protein n=1 Tax=Ceratobasidium theobromae TaxID=1582974 RepID=A0A5N5Q8K5_9AGAM|nr:hypothetical protein CTheo_8501 [Ceratobasidium theobromae]
MWDPKSFLALLEKAKGLGITEANALLKEQGFRPVQNAFMHLGPHTNVFHALSYDTLHTDDLGRWGKHLWPLLKEFLKVEKPELQKNFDHRIDAVPPWPELNHFSTASSMDFSDGTKYEHLLRECTSKFRKSFNFPKMHLLVRLVDDIHCKGVTANFSTKPGKKMHSILRHAYNTSSKKCSTVDAKILQESHILAVYELISAEITTANSLASSNLNEDMNDPESEGVYHTILASRKQVLTLGLLEEQNCGNVAFSQIGTQVCGFISKLDPTFRFSVESPIKAQESQTLKVQYELMVD